MNNKSKESEINDLKKAVKDQKNEFTNVLNNMNDKQNQKKTNKPKSA